MGPKEYKAKYNNLKVKRSNGTVEVVRISKYVLNHSKSFHNKAAEDAFVQMYVSRKIDRDLTIFTDAGEVRIQTELTKAENKWQKKGIPMRFELDDKKGGISISSHDIDWGGLTRYCFLGKGAPEHYQIVLQLADHWGLARNGLQAYADSCLGLDCNGFVGNYIQHGRRGKPWSQGAFQLAQGPDTLISSFFKGGTYVTRWEDVRATNTYILGMVNKANQIVPGGAGPDSAGHIMITQAGQSSHGRYWDTSPRLWVVESTAGAIQPGLTEGWYEVVDWDNKTGVFKFDRGGQMQLGKREIRCKMIQFAA